MCRNVGGVDRAIRALLGVGAIAYGAMGLGAMDGNVAGIVVAGVGVVLVLTAALGFCPAYLPIKLSTCGPKKA